MTRNLFAAFVFAVVVPVACVFAQATNPANQQHLKATVTGIEGIVQVRLADDQPWQIAKEGMEVGENAEFRTGPRSAVRFTIPPDQTVTVDRLSTIKVLQAVNDNGKLKTNLGMKYGRTRYDIEAGGREHESVITSPSSTLAVRGTKVSLFDQRPFPAEAVSLTGRAEFRDFRKHVFFGNKGAGKTRVNVENSTAAGYALGQTVVDPSIVLARSAAETALVNNLLSRGATISFDFDRGIRVIRGGTVPQNDNELVPVLPGSLNFVLRWQGNADLNLGVIEPGNGPGHTVYPIAGSDIIASGGQTAFDHRGGAHGGMEIVFYPTTFPDGKYFVGSQHMSGPDVPATLDVFRDGQRVPIQVGPNTVLTNSFTATPIPPSIASGQGIGVVDIQNPPAKKVSAPKVTAPTVQSLPRASKR